MKFSSREKNIMSGKQKYLRILAEQHTRQACFLFMGQVAPVTPLFNPFLLGADFSQARCLPRPGVQRWCQLGPGGTLKFTRSLWSFSKWFSVLLVSSVKVRSDGVNGIWWVKLQARMPCTGTVQLWISRTQVWTSCVLVPSNVSPGFALLGFLVLPGDLVCPSLRCLPWRILPWKSQWLGNYAHPSWLLDKFTSGIWGCI